MKIIEKLKKWRKKRLEEKYIKAFPERKGMATMEIVQARVKPLTFCHKTMLDPYFHDVTAEMLAALKKGHGKEAGRNVAGRGHDRHKDGSISGHVIRRPVHVCYGACVTACGTTHMGQRWWHGMRNNVGMKFDCIFEEPLDFIDIDYTHLNKTIRYEQRPHGEWIPCSERLPEKSGQYYVSGGGKVWVCNFLIIPDFKGGWCNDVSNPVVKAWMPMPEPYKKEGDGKE